MNNMSLLTRAIGECPFTIDFPHNCEKGINTSCVAELIARCLEHIAQKPLIPGIQAGGGNMLENAIMSYLILHNITSVDSETKIPADLAGQEGFNPVAIGQIVDVNVINQKLQTVPELLVARSKETVLEQFPEILFNLYLVKTGKKGAFLFEVVNYAHFPMLLDLIEKTYPEYQYSVESTVDQLPYRILITNQVVEIPTNDAELAGLLGYGHAGIPSKNQPYYSVSHFITTPGHEPVEFTNELLVDPDELSMIKVRSYEEAAEKLGWHYNYKINHHDTNGRLLIEIIKFLEEGSRDWLNGHIHDVSEILYNYSMPPALIGKYSNNPVETVIDYGDWFQFIALMHSEEFLYGINPPFGQEIANTIDNIVDSVFHMDHSPLVILDRIVAALPDHVDEKEVDQFRIKYQSILGD